VAAKADGSSNIEIKRLEHKEEAHECALFMANSEPWIALRRSYDDSLKIINDPSREVYLALSDGKIVGFVILVMQGALVGYVQSVAVWPEWRNKGIGSKLVRFAEQRIFGEAPNAFILVSSFNERALRLYQRLGYEIVGELKEYIIPGHSEILLRKTIGPLAEFRKRS
jgi:ribosomal-protein-alanine N-acetyltransferase